MSCSDAALGPAKRALGKRRRRAHRTVPAMGDGGDAVAAAWVCVGGGGGEGGGARPWTRRAARSRLGAEWTRSGGPAGTAALGDRFLLLLRENGREGGRIAGSGFRRLSDGERPALMGSPQAPCALLTAAPLHGDGCERGIRNRSTSPLQGGL